MVEALQLHRVPPVYLPGYFLAMTTLQLLLFPALILVIARLDGGHRRERGRAAAGSGAEATTSRNEPWSGKPSAHSAFRALSGG